MNRTYTEFSEAYLKGMTEAAPTTFWEILTKLVAARQACKRIMMTELCLTLEEVDAMIDAEVESEEGR
jgi:hypothetical protein